MKYMGSKSRIANKIVPIIQSFIDEYNPQFYLEPFCGGCNVIDKIRFTRKIASDKNYYLIALLNNLDKLDELPQDFISKEEYDKVRNVYRGIDKKTKLEDWYIGAIGFLASFNGRFFDGGYAGLAVSNGKTRNYYNECLRNLLAQKPLLQKDITFHCTDYTTWSFIHNSVIYCDPPYAGTKQFSISKDFNYATFWDWCRRMSDDNIVLISEENAPSDFKCIWSQNVKRTIKVKDKQNKVEKLFVFKECLL